MAKKSYPLSKVYGLLEPGPVVMVTTANKTRTNIMTMSWHTMLEFEPPLVGCVISGRNFTFDILKATKECVINIPTVALAKKVVGVGNTSGKKIDKFKKFGLTPMAASHVQAPLIGLCLGLYAVHLLAEPLGVWWSYLVGLAIGVAWNGLLWVWKNKRA